MPRRSQPVAARRRIAIVATALVAISACTAAGRGASASSDGRVPTVTPASAYRDFPYTSQVQRDTFQAYLECADEHGIEIRGPYTDSTGGSLFFRLAPGETASRSEQDRVDADCPQLIVGMFGTPLERLDRPSFESSAIDFARCIRSHQFSSFPVPQFGDESPVALFWQLPFDWSSAVFERSVKACVEPLRSYMFSE